jgi:hypothetical protein
MKKSILILGIIVFLAITLFAGCRTNAQKTEAAKDKIQEAKENVVSANQDLNRVINDSILQFKKESAEKISANEKMIADFKAKIKTEKKETKVKYEKKLAELEQKNNDLKKKLEEYNDEGQENWATFRNELNHDMDELGQAIKDLTVKNVN